jgi:biotin carboxyl carrier protein
MLFRRILIVVKWIVALGLIGGLLSAAYWVNGVMRSERARQGEEDKVHSPRRTKDGVVELSAEAAERYALEEAPARAVSWAERIPVYGQVVANPKATVEVRSPFSGTLRAASDTPWPSPGRMVRSGQTVGWIDIRIGAQERLALQDNLNNARSKKEGAEKVVALQRARINRIESVSRSQIVPGQQLDDAKVLLADAETQFAIAAAAVELWQKALEEAARPGHRETTTYTQPLVSPGEGEVTDLSARPGMSIEAGGLVAQIVNFRRILVRLEIPRELLAVGPPGPLRLQANAAGFASMAGIVRTTGTVDVPPMVETIPVGPAPSVDAASQFIGYWYESAPERSEGPSEKPGSVSAENDGPDTLWRPGLQVKGSLTPPSTRLRPAVAVPAGAVLFHQGRALVYVRVKPGAYARREVRLLGRDGDSWVVAARQTRDPSGIEPGEVVVHRGSQLLLSEEFRSDVDID